MKKGLNANTLKVIAIIAMVCDHTAWGFVDMFSVQGQIMHTIGRLTIPIMTFFVAEGYRKTANLKKYIGRMLAFSILTAVPFWLFFGEEYGYRQNFFFDLLLALLTLTVIDSKKLSKSLRILLATTLIIVSMIIGGWPVLPILFVLIFYYGRSFKQKCFLVTGCVTLVEAFLIPSILLNNIYHYAPQYDGWRWYEWLYFFGFVLALPLLKLYNGEKGRYPLGRYFFFLFYPIHFMVLWSIQQFIAGTPYNVYYALHVVCLVWAIWLGLRLALSRSSRPQIAATVMAFAGCTYILGFLIEISSSSVDIAYAGTITEYFGECIIFLSFLWFVEELCHMKISPWVYYGGAITSAAIIWMLLTTRDNHIFYTSIEMDTVSGTFPRLSLEYGPGFFVMILYVFVLCSIIATVGIKAAKKSKDGHNKKRIRFILIAMMCPWIAYLIKLTGITNGYEISVVGAIACCYFVSTALFKYSYFDSVQLAGENALLHMTDAIAVVDANNRVSYINESLKSLVPNVQKYYDVARYPILLKALDGSLDSYKQDDIIYDIIVTPLIELNSTQGYMVCFRDMTEHYMHLEEAEKFAHTDGLTGLLNRNYFMERVMNMRSHNVSGYFLMIDMDNFKRVNDTYGHETGDKVLALLAQTISLHLSDKVISGRLGGDEFCMFCTQQSSDEEIASFGTSLISEFQANLSTLNLSGLTSISVGATRMAGDSEDPALEYKNAYRRADEALYHVKNSEKGTFYIAK